MNLIKQEFKDTLNQKLKDMTDVLFQRFEVGIFRNKNKVSFTEEQIDGSIEFYSFNFSEVFDLYSFKEAFHEKVNSLTNQIFYALDKGIQGNKMKIEISEGNITCFITIKTANHAEENLFFLGDKGAENEESEDTKHMHI